MNITIIKTDLFKEDPNYYKVSEKPEIRDLDTYYYLSISGQCAPENKYFLQSIAGIYKVAYVLKFQAKSLDLDFVVPKLEAFWWVDGGLEKQSWFVKTPAEKWHWKLLIRLPDFIHDHHVQKAMDVAIQKNPDHTHVKRVIHEKINEGRCVQALHVGPFEKEEPTIERMFELLKKEGLKVNNYHHEIYLNDPSKTSPERLKTILRYGVEST